MIFKRISLRTQFVLMLLLISSVGLISSLIIVNQNHERTIENVRESTREIIKYESATLIEKHNNLLADFGLRLQKNPRFKRAVKNSNSKLIQKLLDLEFDQYYVSTKALIVNKIYVYDTDYKLLSESTSGDDFDAHVSMCSQLISAAKKRTRNDRIKLLSSFCYHKKHALNSIVIPIGTIMPIGYLQINSRLYNIFQNAEKKLGMPLRIETILNQKSYQSPDWKINSESDLEISYDILDLDGNPAVSIVMQKEIAAVNKSFAQSRQLIVWVVGCVTLLGIVLFYYIFSKNMLNPLKMLGRQLSVLESDEGQLGSELDLIGSPEMRKITGKFNKLTRKLSDLYGSLENLAYRDQLTMLPNRSRLQEIVDYYADLNNKDGKPFSLFTLDLDRFKTVNDTMGHQAGDQLLIQVSERLNKVLKENDYLCRVKVENNNYEKNGFVSRLGGDEFAIVFPSVGDPELVLVMAERIIRSLRETFVVDQFSFNLGASIGIVICPQHGTNTRLLMQHADVAMHFAKEKQLGFALYDPDFSERSLNILSLDTELRSALKNNDLNLVFQPKISLRTGRIVAVEVLLRWVHKDQGFISPDKFIYVAEQTGLINDVTKWVLYNALKQKCEWEKENINLSMAINLSAKNLWDTSLIGYMREELAGNKIMPQSVILELTETAVMSDPKYAIVILNQLRSLGLKISIDDFGTGYSSLSYLKQLPIDEIKIDRSFVMDMEENENDAVIVQSTIDLAHNMGLKVVAEGVETIQSLEKLKNQACDLAQGFYMAKPMNNQELMKWLRSSQWGIDKINNSQ